MIDTACPIRRFLESRKAMINTTCPMCLTINRVHPNHKLIECPCGCWYTPPSLLSPTGDSRLDSDKVVALARKLIDTANTQGLAWLEEFLPLAQHVIETEVGR